ncbi:MAG: hypothetical protein ACI3W9_06290 [Eubacteriales bacterium]
MTSRSSSSDLFGRRLRLRVSQFYWLLALWCVVLFFIFPIAGALVLEEDEIIKNVTSLVENQIFAVMLFTPLAALLTTGAFSYLSSRSQLDFYHSQPVTRKQLFAMNYLTGWIVYLLPLAVGLIVDALVIMLIPGIAAENILMMLNGFIRCAGMYFSFNALFLFAVMLCGNKFISLLTGIYFCGAPAMLLGMLYYYVDRFSVTFCYDVPFINILKGISPLAYVFDLRGQTPLTAAIIIWVPVSAALVFACLLLYCRRPSETAGKPLAFPKALPFIKYPITASAAWVGGMFFGNITDSLGWAVFGYFIFAALAFGIINGLEKLDFRNVFSNWKKFLIGTVVFIACLILLYLGCMAFDARVTDDKDIVSVDVNSLYCEKYVLLQNPEGSTEYTYETICSAYDLIGIDGEEAISALNRIMRLLIDNDGSGWQNINNGDSLFDNFKQGTVLTTLNVTVHTAHGSYSRRYSAYLLPDSGIYDLLNTVSYSPSAKRSQVVGSINAFSYANDCRVTGAYTSRILYNKEDAGRIAEALVKDIAAAQNSDFTENPVGFVCIQYTYKCSDYEWAVIEDDRTVYIYPSFENTLALLEGGFADDSFEFEGALRFTRSYKDTDVPEDAVIPG